MQGPPGESMTIYPPEQIGPFTWRLSWSSTNEDPTFYVYLDGKLYAETDQESINITLSPGEDVENHVIEIFDDPDDLPAKVFPGRLTLNWRQSDDVDYYKVEEYYDSAWVVRARVYDQGEEYFKWVSRFLEDVTTHEFRITPVGTNGNEGTSVTRVCLMVRHPDHPNFDWSYSDVTHKMTITS